MEVNRSYRDCVFTSATVRAAMERYLGLKREDEEFEKQIRSELEGNSWRTTRRISLGDEHWEFDNNNEFFAAYDAGFEDADFGLIVSPGRDEFSVRASDGRRGMFSSTGTRVKVRRDSRGDIEGVLSVFADQADSARVPAPDPPPPEPPTVYIGHGHSPAWRDLKDHLHDQHGYEVEAYETGARAGHTIRDILAEMLTASSFAVLVMTGEDEQADGSLRARENVVHEVGLFQGHLGFNRAIVALEKVVDPFSNLQGIHQLRFAPGNIASIYGDVLATLRREFPHHRP